MSNDASRRINRFGLTRLAQRIEEAGGQIVCQARVKKILPKSESVIVESDAGEFEAKYVVTCAGLQSDRVAKLSGQNIASKIIPFRGEFYELKPEVHHLCRNLIYPVPDPNFPFLGVHFTRLIHGGIECGPNAVLAFAREGYRKIDFSLTDTKGRRVGVPADKIAYVEVAADAGGRKVGFGSG